MSYAAVQCLTERGYETSQVFSASRYCYIIEVAIIFVLLPVCSLHALSPKPSAHATWLSTLWAVSRGYRREQRTQEHQIVTNRKYHS